MGTTTKLLVAVVVALLAWRPLGAAQEQTGDKPGQRPQIVRERLERQRPPELRSHSDRPADVRSRRLERPTPQEVIAERRPEGTRPGLVRRPDRPGVVRPGPQLLRRPEHQRVAPEASWAGRLERLVQQMRELAGHIRRMEAQMQQLRAENERLKRILRERGIPVEPSGPAERPRPGLVRPEHRDRDVEHNRDRDRHIDRDRDQERRRPQEQHRDLERSERQRHDPPRDSERGRQHQDPQRER